MKYYRPLKNETISFGDYVTDDRFGLIKMVSDHCMIGLTVGDTDEAGFMHYFRPVEICDVDEVLSEYGWMAQELSNIEISPWYQPNETVFTDEDEIRDDITTDIWDDNQDKSDEEFEKIVREIYDREVKSVICVYTTPAGMIR